LSPRGDAIRICEFIDGAIELPVLASYAWSVELPVTEVSVLPTATSSVVPLIAAETMLHGPVGFVVSPPASTASGMGRIPESETGWPASSSQIAAKPLPATAVVRCGFAAALV